MVAEILKPLGLKAASSAFFLIMENTESSKLRDAFRWITRQLLTVRLHHPTWPLVFVHGLATAIACYLTPVLILIALAVGEYFQRRNFAEVFPYVSGDQYWPAGRR